jgi:hypothetical protein
MKVKLVQQKLVRGQQEAFNGQLSLMTATSYIHMPVFSILMK